MTERFLLELNLVKLIHLQFSVAKRFSCCSITSTLAQWRPFNVGVSTFKINRVAPVTDLGV